MVRKLTSKEYDALSQRIERMADGIAKHREEEDFPKRLDSSVRREWRQSLEDVRSRYEELMLEVAQAYDRYCMEFKRISVELGKDDDTLRGYYGKNNPVVGEFGTKVIGKPTGRKKVKAIKGKT